MLGHSIPEPQAEQDVVQTYKDLIILLFSVEKNIKDKKGLPADLYNPDHLDIEDHVEILKAVRSLRLHIETLLSSPVKSNECMFAFEKEKFFE
jgi:hypothetical protein